jgi:hypothetical protein
MEKLTVYGLPLAPRSALEHLAGKSFCVSYATRSDLGTQLNDAIRLVGDNQILMLDNGAFSLFKRGITSTSDEYLDGFEAWASSILDRCPQALAVVPDVIGGTEEQNAELVRTCALPIERCMPVWHLHESFDYLRYLLDAGFEWLAFGSSGQYWKPGTPEWHARIQAAFDCIAQWERESGELRPHIHMMRAQSFAHLYAFDSSDSTNVAMNHNRQARLGEPLPAFAARVDGKIQASAGAAVEHQIRRGRPVDVARSCASLRHLMLEIWMEAIEARCPYRRLTA